MKRQQILAFLDQGKVTSHQLYDQREREREREKAFA